MKALFKSLRSRIFAFILIAGIVPVVLLHVLVVNVYESTLIKNRSTEIKQRINMISASISSNENIKDALTPEERQILSWYSDAFGGRLLIIDNIYHVLFDTYYADTGKTVVSEAVFDAFSGKTYEYYETDPGFLEFVVPVYYMEGEEKTITGALVFSSTTGWIRDAMTYVDRLLWTFDFVVFALLLLTALLMTGNTIKPLKTAALNALKLESGVVNVDESALLSYTEVDKIVHSSAEAIRHYQELEESQEQFVSNVSHELRTPMTSIRVLSDSLIGQQNIPEETYQEFLTDISAEVERETNILEDLLSMSRLGKVRDSMMNISTLNINNFLLDILKTLKPIAESRQIDLIYESFRQVQADVDEPKLSQAFVNLIENGIKYNNDGGWVRVSLDADHEYFYVRIADNGCGIPEDAISRVFDRFYRVDKARSRETGGTGLGLAITRQIILLHFGVIKVESVFGEGTTFTVRIPLKHVEQEGVKS